MFPSEGSFTEDDNECHKRYHQSMDLKLCSFESEINMQKKYEETFVLTFAVIYLWISPKSHVYFNYNC